MKKRTKMVTEKLRLDPVKVLSGLINRLGTQEEHGSSILVVQDFNVDVARWGSECQKNAHLYSASGP